ncbi:MAG: hypothetical protein K6D94_09015 [Clostridiales bacterium]|nr:hypothetical protein [Clostridiales bacterium]
MSVKPKIGLLPLYIELYYSSSPDMTPVVTKFRDTIAGQLRDEGLDVLAAPVCAVRPEFEAAVKSFEDAGCCAIVTLHLAYSPSLESSDALAKTRLPIIVLDTTPTLSFTPSVDAGPAINYNHGIHGVQDMCNLLCRNGKDFTIFAGHHVYSDVIKQAADACRAAAAAERLKGMKTALIGEPFKGMGDFDCGTEALASLGVEVIKCMPGEIKPFVVVDTEIKEEYELDKKRFDVSGVSYADYEKTERVALAVREWIDQNGIGAFTMNFQSAGLVRGFDTMPFTEASKAMARGIGYAGEGDLLTASVCGAMVGVFPDATFMEMFCPDWAGNHVYFSHMGELNLRAMQRGHMALPPFSFAPCFAPTRVYGVFKPGKATIVNTAPTADGFRLVLAEGRMIDLPKDIGSFGGAISGWFKPNIPVAQLLKKYSMAGGTHHSVLVYGASAESLSVFGKQIGAEVCVIE